MGHAHMLRRQVTLTKLEVRPLTPVVDCARRGGVCLAVDHVPLLGLRLLADLEVGLAGLHAGHTSHRWARACCQCMRPALLP